MEFTYGTPIEVKRWDIINHLIEKNNLVNYLEIGVNDGECIRKIKAIHKDGVDPYPASEVGGNIVVPEINYPISSDSFFELIKGSDIKYDIIFIDGLHHSEQVNKDINNSLNHLVDDGFIVLHDLNPIEEIHSLVPRVSGTWNGDCYKSAINIRVNHPELQLTTIHTDWGIGILQKLHSRTYDKDRYENCIKWEYFNQNRVELLNLISTEEFFKTF